MGFIWSWVNSALDVSTCPFLASKALLESLHCMFKVFLVKLKVKKGLVQFEARGSTCTFFDPCKRRLILTDFFEICFRSDCLHKKGLHFRSPKLINVVGG